MNMTPELLGRKHSIVEAEHTLQIAFRAYREGNLRLAVSRGITAVIQASIASVGAILEIKERADRVVQAVRKMIQGVALKRAAARVSALGVLPRRSILRQHPVFVNSVRLLERQIAEHQEEVDSAILREIFAGGGELPEYLATEIFTAPFKFDEAVTHQLVPPVEIQSNVGLKLLRGKPFLFMTTEPDAPADVLDFMAKGGLDPTKAIMGNTGVAVAPEASEQAAHIINKGIFMGSAKINRWLKSALHERTLDVLRNSLRKRVDAVARTIIENEVEKLVTKTQVTAPSGYFDPRKQETFNIAKKTLQSLPKSIRDKLTLQIPK